MAVSQSAKKKVWIWQFLNKLLLEDKGKEIKILGNNETNLILTRDLESQNQTKHVNIMHYHVHGLVEDGKRAIK